VFHLIGSVEYWIQFVLSAAIAVQFNVDARSEKCTGCLWNVTDHVAGWNTGWMDGWMDGADD